MNLKGKKLLIMGGPALACDIVNKAQSLGIYTIVTDWYSKYESPAKKISDESFMISTADVESIVNLIKQENIDGVITGFTDSTLPYYQKVCKLAGLPCYLTEEQVKIVNNKKNFKNLCKEFDIPVVEEYQINNISDLDKCNKVEFPIIIKPVDNSGARGITICYNISQLNKAYEKALKYSDDRSVIIERYMNAKEATVFYLLRDGEIFLIGIGDRHTKNNQSNVIPLPVAYTFPSLYLDNYLKEMNHRVINMFKSIGMKNGVVFIQSFVEHGRFIFYEMGYRLTGSLEYKIMEPIIGINPLKMMIEFSLTGKMGEADLINKISPRYNLYGCNITFLVKPGKIGKIEGINQALSIPGVLDAFSSYTEGDIIPESAKGTLQQVALRVFAVTKSIIELKTLMDKVHSIINIKNAMGEDMLLDHFDTEELINE